MANNIKLDFSLRLKHPEANLTRFAHATGLQVAQAWTKGDPRKSSKGRTLGGVRDASYCSMKLGIYKAASLSDALQDCLDKLNPARRRLRAIVRSGGTASLAVGWFCRGDVGASVSTESAKMLARLGLTLDLYIYVVSGSLTGRA